MFEDAGVDVSRLAIHIICISYDATPRRPPSTDVTPLHTEGVVRKYARYILEVILVHC
jgi:hypothetical protein